MKELTRAQEDIMQIIWDLGRCTVGDIRAIIEEKTGKKPPHSTVSAVVLALNKLGYLKHEEYGRTFVYEPNISKDQYGNRSLKKLVQNYFGNSMNKMLTHLVKREDLSVEEINELLKKLDQ